MHACRSTLEDPTRVAGLVQPAPVAYQEAGGDRQLVAARFTVDGDRVGFAVGEYDRTRPLVIDPMVLFGTYAGGNGSDVVTDMAMVADGTVLLAGRTASAPFPAGADTVGPRGSGDAFVLRLDPDQTGASSLVYATHFGGGGADAANGVVAGPSGEAYVVGETSSSDFPTTAGALRTTQIAGQDGFAVKIQADGDALDYGTYLGGNGDDSAEDVALDGSGRAYVTGVADGLFVGIILPGGMQPAPLGGTDGYLVSLEADGSGADYLTYLGGTGDDRALGVDLDGAGRAHVVGETESGDFLPIENGAQTTHGGGSDAFLTVIDLTVPGIAGREYGTFLGGAGDERAHAVDVDGGGISWMVGEGASGMPTSAGAASTSAAGGSGFLAAYDSSQSGGGSRELATFIPGADEVTAVSASGGTAWVAGEDRIAEVNGSGTTILASDSMAAVVSSAGIARHSGGQLLWGGTAGAGLSLSGQLQSHQGGNDAFLARVIPAQDGVTIASDDDARAGAVGTNVQYTITVTNDQGSADTFDIGVAVTGQAWNTTGAPASVNLAAGASTMFTVTVAIPGGATAAQTSTATITATSDADGSISDSVAVTTSVDTSTRSVSVTPPTAAANAGAGGQAQYMLSIQNTGALSDSYDITVSGNAYTTTPSVTSVGPLAPGANTMIAVTVDVPGGTANGQMDSATVTVTSQASGSVSDSSVLTTTVNSTRGVTVTPMTQTGAGDPGAVVNYSITIENTGNASDTYSLAVTAGGTVFPASVMPTTVGPVAPGSSDMATISVMIPAGVAADTMDGATVTVTSMGDATVSATASVTTTASTAAMIVVTPVSAEMTGAPGSTVTYVITVTNNGNAADTFAISLDNEDWPTVVPATLGPVNPGAMGTFMVMVTVPDDAEAGDDDSVTVTVTSGNDPSIDGSSSLNTEAGQNYGVELETESGQDSHVELGGAGATLRFELTLTNVGNGRDTFTIEVEDTEFETESDVTSVGPLDAGESETFTVEVHIPANVRRDDQDTVTVTAISQGDADQRAQVDLSTHVTLGTEGWALGSGCAVAAARAGGEGGAGLDWLLVGVAAAGVGLRRRRRAWLLVAALLLVATPAFAQNRQGFRLETYRSPPSVEDGFAMEMPHTLGASRFAFKLSLDYARDPLVVTSDNPDLVDDPDTTAVISDRLPAHLSFVIGLGDHLEAFAIAPVLLWQDGEDGDMAIPEFESPSSFALMDPEVGVALSLLGRDQPVHVGMSGAVRIPIGSEDALASDGSVAFRGGLQASVGGTRAAWALEVGAQYRDERDYARYRTGPELYFATGVHVPVGGDFFLGAELFGSTALGSDFFNQYTTPMEALVGVRYLTVRGLVVGLAGGFGIGPAPGTPAARALLTVGWASEPERSTLRPLILRVDVDDEEPLPDKSQDPDGDAIVGSFDKCPAEAEDLDDFEDLDGCPDTDDDGDGIFDIHDRCPKEKETRNEHEDLDGCPDSLPGEQPAPEATPPGEPPPLEEVTPAQPAPTPPAEPAPAPAQPAPAGPADKPILPGPITFADGSSRIDALATPALEEILGIMQRYPQIRSLAIEGHASQSGSRATNMILSRQRAQAIRDWLVARGIDSRRVLVVGHGADRSRGMDAEEARRVEFRIAKWDDK